MVRFGLTFSLMLITAVEPWFCCCTAAELAGLFKLANAAMVRAKEETGNSSCCCHHDQAPVKKEQSDKPGPPPGHSCPCHESLPSTALVAAADVSLGTTCTRWTPLLDLAAGSWLPPLPNAPLVTARGPVPRECAAFPYCSPRDILRTLHLLRC